MKRLSLAAVTLLCSAGLTLTLLPAGSSAASRSAQTPTLGLDWQSSDYTGFGTVRPRSTDGGGDPTGDLLDIHWTSWGGAEAVGHAKADWVWPGWDVADGSVLEPVTVVAYDLGDCGSQPAYRRISWYFPSMGEPATLTSWQYNLCDGAYVGPISSPHELTCRAYDGATQITSVGGNCSEIDAVIKRLDPGHYRSQKFRVTLDPRTYCGSDSGRLIECIGGSDSLDVDFDVD